MLQFYAWFSDVHGIALLRVDKFLYLHQGPFSISVLERA